MHFTAAAAGLLLAVAGCSACGVPEEHRSESALAAATPAESLLSAGEALHDRGQFDSARVVLLRAVAASRAADDEHTVALALTRLGLAAWRLGDMRAAGATQDSALQLKLRLGMNDELSRSYNALGLLALSQSRNREAARLFEQAIAAASAVADHAGIARATGNAALAYGYLGDLRRAREGSRTLRTAGRALGDRRYEANGLANEAMIDVAEGDPHVAAARLDTARALYREISYTVGEQNALGQLATALAAMGEFGRAFAVLDSALSLARRNSLLEQEIETLRLLGGLHMRIGDHRRAVRYYDQAERAAVKAGLQADIASVHRGAAEAHLLLGNVPVARTHALRAMQLHEEAAEPLDELDDALVLAAIEERAGNRAAASGQLVRAAAIARSVGTRGANAQVVLARARLSESDGNPRAVLRALADLDPAMRELDYEARWSSAAQASRAYARLGLLDSAVSRGREAVDALERVRGGLPLEPMRGTFAAERAGVYGDLVVTLLRLGRTAEAFEVADRARSRGLFEHLSSARAGVAREVPRELVEADALLRRIDALVEVLRRSEPQRRRLRGEPVAGADELLVELAGARAEYEALLLRASGRNPRAVAIAGAGGPSLPEVPSILEADEALIEYFLGGGKLIAFVVRAGGIAAIHTDLDEAGTAERVRLLRDLWGRPRRDWRVGLPASAALYGALISPLREQGHLAGVRRLVVVPHGKLAQIPFAALRDAKSGRFLGEDMSVVYAPSAAALAALRARGPNGSESTSAAWAFAPLRRELPATVAEVRAFARAVRGSVVAIGPGATEAALRSALEAGGVVHVATHGALNRHHPLFSRIELARPRVANPEDDGRLEVRELLALDVRSSLVFLSGCETGAGEGWLPEAVRGSGELTMSHAFLLAGARNVVSTLWRIEDAGASVFATRFYEHLVGAGVAESISRTQREMMRDPRYSSPYYWAGYVLSGDGVAGLPAARTVAASVR